jgi:hypothetical protein
MTAISNDSRRHPLDVLAEIAPGAVPSSVAASSAMIRWREAQKATWSDVRKSAAAPPLDPDDQVVEDARQFLCSRGFSVEQADEAIVEHLRKKLAPIILRERVRLAGHRSRIL